MAAKKRQKKFNIDKNLLFVLLIAFFTLVYLSLFTDNLGFIGLLLAKLSFNIFGLASYLIFPVFIVNLILVLVNKFDKKTRNIFLFIYLGIVIFLSIIDFTYASPASFVEKKEFNMRLANYKEGSGLLGTVVAFILAKSIGRLGTYILFAVLVFFFVLYITDLSIKDFFSVIKDKLIKLKNKLVYSINNYREEKRLKKASLEDGKLESNKEDKFIEKKTNINKRTDKSKLKIKDYNENEGDSQLSVEDYKVDLGPSSNYSLPPLELLKSSANKSYNEDIDIIEENAEKIEKTLESFNIDSKVVQVNRGPRVTSYELQPAGGVKVSSIVNLQDNLALSLASSGIRIEAPIPGKSLVGIEVPNKSEDSVNLKDIIVSESFKNNDYIIPFALGKDISGKSIVTGIEKMPHLLIAGATGSGKSVCINTLIMSILFKLKPEDVKLILIDPKMVELNVYNGIPHLVIPVVTDPKKASAALNWAVREMERRYKIFTNKSVRDITSYKEHMTDEDENLPYIVIIIDELSDLMMVAANEVEDHISRLAQMSRACGIHLVIATQRPSVDVITGTIKANIPSRISFSVSSQIDSRTILDMSGAEKLLGKGDMLFFPSSYMKPLRIQGAFISDSEVENIVSYIKDHSNNDYDEEVIEEIKKDNKHEREIDAQDELLSEAIDLVIAEGQASVSLIQRRLHVGYARAGRIIDQMEALGVIEGHQGSKPRDVLVDRNILQDGGSDEFTK